MEPRYAPEWLEAEKRFGGRMTCRGDPLGLRAHTRQMQGSMAKPPLQSIERIDITIENNTPGFDHQIRIHKPSHDGPLPVCVYFHSGGFIMGDLDTEAEFCDWLADALPCIVVQSHYRLAPENPHPAAFDDARVAWKWTCRQIGQYGGDSRKMFVMGAAAGGTLALSLTSSLVMDAKTQEYALYSNFKAKIRSDSFVVSSIKACVALAPITLHPKFVPPKFTSRYTAYHDNAKAWMVDGESMDIFLSAVQANPHDPRQFPALEQEGHKHFPPTYIAVCEGDVLRDDGLVMEEVLREAGCTTLLDRYDGMPHSFWAFPVPQAQQFKSDLLQGLHVMLDK